MKAFLSLAFSLAGIHVGTATVVPEGRAPAWTPHGQRIAYAVRGNLWVVDADGSNPGLIERGAHRPVWAPNGRRLAFERGGFIWTVRANGTDERRLVAGFNPTWSPHGDLIAFDREGKVFTVPWWYGTHPRRIAAGTDPTYSPSGRLAWVRDRHIIISGVKRYAGSMPAWLPDSKQIAYVRDGKIYVNGRWVATGTEPAWRPTPRVRELLPDLVQRVPSDLVVAGRHGHWLLGSTSMIDTVGLGPLVIIGDRPEGSKLMDASQQVDLENGKKRTYAKIGHLRYVHAGNHHHWHLLRYDTYELRSQTGDLLVRDHKAGFCLADHYGLAPGNFDRHPRFLGNCEQFNPKATHVLEGTSLGYTDRYPAFFHGQNDDITGLVAGVYVLVHRANPNMIVHELRYENDASSVRIRITWRHDVPSVKVLKTCPGSPTC